ncbi:MAG TPA: vitamin K epoxide reductase family protein [Gemmatimonadales bacterium]|nr:vitamin K epoxide reductase family protein [Gemmatimonadales bacterium]
MKWRMGAALLSLLGIFVAAYLYLYKIGRIGSVMCGSGGCETVQLSRWSSFAGVDVALIGLVGYVGLLGLSLLSLQPRFAGARWPAQLLALLSGIGVVFAIYLTWLELFVIHAICRWCVGSAVIITAIFATALLDLRAHRAPERAA